MIGNGLDRVSRGSARSDETGADGAESHVSDAPTGSGSGAADRPAAQFGQFLFGHSRVEEDLAGNHGPSSRSPRQLVRGIASGGDVQSQSLTFLSQHFHTSFTPVF